MRDAVDCPNCHAPMAADSLDAVEGAGGTVAIDRCDACSLFWFDATEDLRLAPRAVVALFQAIGQAGRSRNALSLCACPRCARTLLFTHDLQRATRFTYWRCPQGHGKLITFHQFLAEKNFLRPPSPRELQRLRDTVRQVACSQCGAPIDLRNDSACPHCGTPVTLIDSQSVATTLRELDGAAATPAAEVTPRALDDAQIDALFDLEKMRQRDAHHDVLAVGVAAVGAAIAAWLAGR